MAKNKYKLLSGSHTRWEGDKETGERVVYNTGDVMEDLSPAEIANFGENIRKVYDDEDEDEKVEAPKPQATPLGAAAAKSKK